MKIFDCTTYYDEELILDLRFNMLNEYVDKFVVCEAKFSHAGKEKKLNFDINNFAKFKDKIIYIVLENEPADLIYDDDKKKIESSKNMRTNSIKRIALQRNKLLDGVDKISELDDYILYSDNDE
jgi:beta-1,4-mannosyl-glycoprotein beta-1,4-N-acetylglucosaminyltransferase